MPTKNTIYEITITDEGLDNYKNDTISAKDMAEDLGIDSVMTDFEWDEDINKGLILTGRIVDDTSVQDALSEMKNIEYIESVEKS
ncbi:hypothetical protein [Clostridium sp. CF012]|uniref:hypothetical protein n=1 Tax=Clostridium sp. CF012 TaxID=2843319 RepID=UPI001C0E74D4|nr:hypothetical protein [Clostridium sp. CF012]MBU3141941.1 hypothetical protein [Clostridium sp. CF012]